VKASHGSVRAHNERLVFATVFDSGQVSRADVARATGLTRPTVSDVMSTLLERGLVQEVGRGPSTGGKAPILLRVPADARHIVVVHLGEFAFRGAVLNLRGEVLTDVEVPAEDLYGEEALENVRDLVRRLVATADRPLVGIGVGVPGLANTDTGTIIESVNLGWRDLPLGPMLQESHGLPVYVANDGQATALAEHVFGGRRTENLFVVTVGRGIGAGVVLDRVLYQGDGWGAGEIGHTVVVDDGVECRCGNRGCLETVASSRAIFQSLSDGPPESPRRSLATTLEAFSSGDSKVRQVVLEAGRQLGAALAGVIGALDIHRIVLTGPVTAFGSAWLDALRESMASRALQRLSGQTTVELGVLGEDAVLLGASALLLTRELGLKLPPAAPENASSPSPDLALTAAGRPGQGGARRSEN
jgi:N-acetylglucosamine repressor